MSPRNDNQPAAVLAARWSALHHDLDPAGLPLLRGWLRLMWTGGRVLARLRVPPTAVTAAGVVLAGSSVGLARDRPMLAASAVLGAAVCDGLDGATAVVADRATRHGARADAVADRLADAAFAMVLFRRGASAPAAGAAVSLAWGVDTLRRVRRVPAKVTMAERPTFTICALVTCLSAPVTSRRWPARVSAAVWVAAGVVGIGQLLTVSRGTDGRGDRLGGQGHER